MNALLGRVLLALLFIGSFMNKLAEFGEDGGPAAKMMAPKVAATKAGIEAFVTAKAGVPFQIPPVEDKYLLGAAMFLEGAGALLYIVDYTLGAKMLMTFLLVVTPIMHDFWTNDPASGEFQINMIMFLKNLAIFGALLTYCDMKKSLKKAKKAVSASKKTN